MYDTLTFPTVASDVFQSDSLRVSVDATFACVVVEHPAGRDVFRFDEPTRSFVFVCASIADDALQGEWPAMCDVSVVLCDLAPWLIDEIAAVKKAWTEFFGGGRELPVLTRSERQSLRRGRLRLVAGIDQLNGMSWCPVVQERPIRSEFQAI